MKLSPADIATALANGGSLSKSVAETLAEIDGKALAWKCACGWTGYPAEMRSNALGHRTCPDCGGSGGLMSMPLAAPPPAPECSEEEFQASVIKYAEAHGWKWYHTRLSKRSPAGWPDLVLCRFQRLILAELKTETGKESEAQREWRKALEAVGGHVSAYLWRPSMWAEIQEVLR